MVAIFLQSLELDISVAFVQTMTYVLNVKQLDFIVIQCLKLEDKNKLLNLLEHLIPTEEITKVFLKASLLKKRSIKLDLLRKTLEIDSRSPVDKNLLKVGLSEILVKLTGL